MSGGHFAYDESRIKSIIAKIEYELREYKSEYSDETIEEFENALWYLNNAYIYAHRIDYLLSGDDGEETFHSRLKEDRKPLITGALK